MWWPCALNGQHLGQFFVSFSLLTLTGFPPLIMAFGSFEIKLIKLDFPKQSQCICDTTKSNVKVSVCLSHHVLPPLPDPRCTLGKASKNGWSERSPAIDIPFSYTWSGRFTLSVRASCQCPTADNAEILVSQIILAHSLNPSREWTSVSTDSSDLNSNVSEGTEVSLLLKEDLKQRQYTNPKFKAPKSEEREIEPANARQFQTGRIQIDTHSDRIDMSRTSDDKHPRLQITTTKQELRGNNGHRFSGDLWSHEPMQLTLSDEDNNSYVARDIKDSQLNDTFLGHQHGTMTLVLRVTCQQYYYGNGCVLYCKPRDDFVGHFRCSDEGSKICLPGWKGKHCTEALCPPKCLPSRGHCRKPFTCVCLPGWHGQFCDKCQTSRGCYKGYCHKPSQCLCHKGWTGRKCDKEIDYEQLLCQHGGTRLKDKTCLCTPGHTGMYCEFSLCQESICSNNGTCLISPDGPYCKCPSPFGGLRCQHNYNDTSSLYYSFRNSDLCADPDCTPKSNNVVPNPCQHITCLNNGTCQVSSFSKDAFCKCVPFYIGSRCETLLDPCAKNPCKNRGKCIHYVNNTVATADGMAVGVNVTSEDSLFTIKCKCRRGFVGEKCDKNKRQRPTKISKRKKCGLKCKKKKLPYVFLNETKNICQNGAVCQNGGTCIQSSRKGRFRCHCRERWAGEFCEIDQLNSCASQVCLNGGKCRVKSFVPYCICPAGYNGHYCENPVHVCTRRTCRNGGICIESKGQFFCVCKRKYFGKFCERTWHSQGIKMPFTVHVSYSESYSCRPLAAFIVILCWLSVRIVIYV